MTTLKAGQVWTFNKSTVLITKVYPDTVSCRDINTDMHYSHLTSQFYEEGILIEDEIKVGQVWQNRDYEDFLTIKQVIPDICVIGTLSSLTSSDVPNFKYPLPRFKEMWTLKTDVVDTLIYLPEGYQVNSDLLPTEDIGKIQDFYTQTLLGFVETTGRKVGWDE